MHCDRMTLTHLDFDNILDIFKEYNALYFKGNLPYIRAKFRKVTKKSTRA